MHNDTASPDRPDEIYSGFKVLTIDRNGAAEWLPIITAQLLSAKGVAALRRDASATLLLFLDEP